MLWRHAHVFPESNQPQRDDAHNRHRCTQPFRSFQLEPFRTNATLEGFMKCFNEPSGSLLERTLSGLLEACDLGITQQDPFQPFWRVRLYFPDPHCGALDARLTAQAIARAPGGTAFDCGGTAEEGGSPRWLIGQRPQLQYTCTSGGRPAYDLKEAPGPLAVRVVTEGPIFGRTNDEPMAENLTTAPVFIDVRLTIPDPAPAYPFGCGANPLAGVLPFMRLPLPVLSRLGGLARCALSTRLPHIIVLVAQSYDAHGGRRLL